ncbi:MAG TPA: peptide chain release factor N(5)-glutamine methyltransferase [Gammaproteobacteria bacterium]|nr:peptide chain release factor N(5)-glutamine methyltransferase [Gammaproteobacteria bacterium]|tara:strand:+ start:210 stop:1028 length:819 start_codon:yes stop_codon:yes gene_type:complete
MTLPEIQRLESIRAARWTQSEQQLVFSEVLGLTLTEQILSAESPVSDSKVEQVLDIAKRSIAGEPLAYILGVTYFDGLKLAIDSKVLIPRPDTEILVEVASELISSGNIQSVHDLCTGSGAVALAIKARHPECVVTASDLSEYAVRCMAQNATALQLDVECARADLFEGLLEFELITANPPYIGSHDPEVDADVVAHEPAEALFSGDNGLSLIQRILWDAPNHLAKGGLLCLEHGYSQAHDVRELAIDIGWRSVQTLQDLAGRDRVTRMQKP